MFQVIDGGCGGDSKPRLTLSRGSAGELRLSPSLEAIIESRVGCIQRNSLYTMKGVGKVDLVMLLFKLFSDAGALKSGAYFTRHNRKLLDHHIKPTYENSMTLIARAREVEKKLGYPEGFLET